MDLNRDEQYSDLEKQRHAPRKSKLEPFRNIIIHMYRNGDSLEAIRTAIFLDKPIKVSRSTIQKFIKSIDTDDLDKQISDLEAQRQKALALHKLFKKCHYVRRKSVLEPYRNIINQMYRNGDSLEAIRSQLFLDTPITEISRSTIHRFLNSIGTKRG